MAQSLWFNDFPLTSDKFHSQYLPTFVFQSWTFAFWIKYLCPAWHITAPTIWDQNWVPYRCQQIKYCNCYGGELLLLSRIGIFSLVMARSVVTERRGQTVMRSVRQLEPGPAWSAASGAIRGLRRSNGWLLRWSHSVSRVARIRRRQN